MIRILLALGLLVTPALSQSIERFDTYMNSVPSASTPLGGTEPVLVLQSGSVKQVPSGKVAGFESVLAHGADPDDVSDSTSAFNAAAATGKCVFIPKGTYKITGSISLGVNPCVFGEGMGGPNAIATDQPVSMIDATGYSGTSNALLQGTGNSSGATFRDFGILGITSSSAPASEFGGVVGINPGIFARHVSLTNVYTSGFSNAIVLNQVQIANLINVNSDFCGTHCLAISSSSIVNSIGSLWANAAGISGASNASNIYVKTSTQINFYDALVDEAFNGAPAVYIRGGTDISFNNETVFCTDQIGDNAQGFLLDTDGSNYPVRVTLNNVRVDTFAGNACANTIKILGGSGDRLINVVTNPHGGGDISDANSDTQYINVNSNYGTGALGQYSIKINGNVRLDYNISNSNEWTSGVPLVLNSGSSYLNLGSAYTINNSGNTQNLDSLGLVFGSGLQMASGHAVIWGNTTTALSGFDTGLSRDSAGVVDVGNGTAGDFSGTIKATNWNSGGTAGVSCSGSPSASFASVHGIVTHC